MGPPGPRGPNGHPGPPGPPASGTVTHTGIQPCVPTVFVSLSFSCVYLCGAGLYLVGEKGERGLPGPPGRCDCDSTLGRNNAPFGSYTQQGGSEKVPAVRPHSY